MKELSNETTTDIFRYTIKGIISEYGKDYKTVQEKISDLASVDWRFNAILKNNFKYILKNDKELANYFNLINDLIDGTCSYEEALALATGYCGRSIRSDENLNKIIQAKKTAYDKARELMESGKINDKDNYGTSELIRATVIDDLNSVIELIKSGADINIKNIMGETALYIAVRDNKFQMVKFLVNNEANINLEMDTHGETVLHLAADNGHIGIVKILVENGAELNLKSRRGMTALDYAIKKGNTNIANFLRQKMAEAEKSNGTPVYTLYT